MVTVGLARTRRTTTITVMSSTSAFHSSAAPAPAWVPVSAAPYAPAEPATVAVVMTSGHRPGSGELRIASSSTTANRPICTSVVRFLPLNAENR